MKSLSILKWKLESPFKQTTINDIHCRYISGPEMMQNRKHNDIAFVQP